MLLDESVATRAGVGPRTVYRHFPTRRDLTTALWKRLRDETGTRWPATRDEITPSLRKTYRQFEEYAELTPAAVASAANTEYPKHGSAEGRAAFRQCLAPLLSELSAANGNQFIASCVAVYSAPFWQMLRDRGLLSARGAEDAAVCMEAIVEAFQPPASRSRRRKE